MQNGLIQEKELLKPIKMHVNSPKSVFKLLNNMSEVSEIDIYRDTHRNYYWKTNKISIKLNLYCYHPSEYVVFMCVLIFKPDPLSGFFLPIFRLQ